MIILRPANTRGNPSESWINSYRTFYFPPYMDKTYTNFSDLETINDDRVQPNGHVPIHEHKNMEIFGYVVEGKCRHTDNIGNNVDIPSGAVQRMSAGSGIFHTEGNSTDTPNRYLQLWIKPNVLDTEPRHDWYQFTREDKLNKFCDVTEKLPIKQDAKLLAGIFTKLYEHTLEYDRSHYLYVVSGISKINNIECKQGDGLVLENMTKLSIDAQECEIILLELR